MGKICLFLTGASRRSGFKKNTANVFGLGEVAFVRWLVCRKAILPNPCYTLARLISRMFNWNTKPFSFLF